MKNTSKNFLASYLILFCLLTACVQQDPPTDDLPVDCNVSELECDDTVIVPDEPETPIKPEEPIEVPVEPTPAPPATPVGDAFNSPWKREGTSIVIDAYELNPINWNLMATDTKVVGVIHRSSIGMRVDKKYVERKKIAKDRGYLWGAYHLGTRDNTKAQADLFLSLINDEEDTLMILDLEDTSSTKFMTIDQAVVFMEYIYEKTGRVPVVYANHSTTRLLNQRLSGHPLMEQAKLWYARFTSRISDFPVGIWDSYFLWQFSSEINCSKTGSCLYNVPGTLYDMDVNVYNGNEAQLRYEWSTL